MTPKEKALELVSRFKNISIELGESHSQLLAEANALIAVDEIINELEDILNFTGNKLSLKMIKYWMDVKKEIEQL